MKVLSFSLVMLALASAGCSVGALESAGNPAPAATSRPLCAATPGGDGGIGGVVTIAYAESLTGSPRVDVNGGPGGTGGRRDGGARAKAGRPGETGIATFVQDTTYAFDSSAIEPGSQIIADVDAVTISVPTLGGTSTTVAVETVDVKPGALLEIGGDLHLVVQHLVVEEGATLRLRGRTTTSLVFSSGSISLVEPGLSGAIASIDADVLEVRGTIDASGNDGAPSADGGAGSDLAIQARTATFGTTTRFSANGGRGGDGQDETSCP
jgi:hypothetical protein